MIGSSLLGSVVDNTESKFSSTMVLLTVLSQNLVVLLTLLNPNLEASLILLSKTNHNLHRTEHCHWHRCVTEDTAESILQVFKFPYLL